MTKSHLGCCNSDLSEHDFEKPVGHSFDALPGIYREARQDLACRIELLASAEVLDGHELYSNVSR